MIVSGQTLRRVQPVSPFCERTRYNGVTYGVGPAGYDVRGTRRSGKAISSADRRSLTISDLKSVFGKDKPQKNCRGSRTICAQHRHQKVAFNSHVATPPA